LAVAGSAEADLAVVISVVVDFGVNFKPGIRIHFELEGVRCRFLVGTM
jgi:hypothetical protein